MKTVFEPVIESEQQAAVPSSESATQSTPASGPLFVIGLWRSGTSLFYALLNQHPQISLLYEGDLFLLRSLFRLPGAKSRWVERWQFWNQAISRHHIETDGFPDDSYSFRSSFEAAYKEAASRKGAMIWGEKSPNYFDCMESLSKQFPDARFIVIWRDPRAICQSIVKAARQPSSWFNRKGMMIRTLIGYRVMKTQCDLLVARGAQLHQLQYETLVQDPTAAMTGVCRFLGLPFEPAMASLNSADRSAIYEGAHHSMVKGGDIDAARARQSSPKLPSGFEQKIERYLAMWQKRFNRNWPQLPVVIADAKPSAWERLSDYCAYRYFRGIDSIIGVIYSLAPLSLLAAWRGLGRQVEEKVERSSL